MFIGKRLYTRFIITLILISTLHLINCSGNDDGEYISNNEFYSDIFVTSIISPQPDKEFVENDNITLACTAMDYEDGELSGDSLIWTSSLDGQIGVGDMFSINRLTIGAHVITLNATNSRGDSVTDTINITVIPESNKIERIYSNIVGDTLWKANTIYIIEKNIQINGELTIEPGTIVKFRRNKRIQGRGDIIALGNENKPIIFTSYNDDRSGGDTNGDEDNTNPVPGDWAHIEIVGGQNRSVFTFCEFYYGGATGQGEQTLLLEPFTNATVTNCTFAHNTGEDSGALCVNNVGSGTKIAKNNFYDNVKPLCVVGDIRFNIDDSNIFHNPKDLSKTNKRNGIFIQKTPSIVGNITWAETEVPFVVLDDLAIDSDNLLTLSDNIIIKFYKTKLNYQGDNLNNYNGRGVYFTSYNDDELGGDTNNDGNETIASGEDWFGIYNSDSPPYFYEEWDNILYGITNGYRGSLKTYFNNDYIDEEGFRYFTLNPQSGYPIIFKTLSVNVSIEEGGFYIEGTIYIITLDGEEIEIHNCELMAEYGEDGIPYGLRKLYGSASFPMPDIEMLSLLYSSEFINDFLTWLETANSGQVEIGIDLGENMEALELPLKSENTYMFFKLSLPFYLTGIANSETTIVLDPLNATFFFDESVESSYPLLTSSLNFTAGISLYSQIPFILKTWDEVGKDKPDYFEQFSETPGMIDLSFDWFGKDFEGFYIKDDKPGFDAHLYFKGDLGLGMPLFAYIPGNLSFDGTGELFLNIDPDLDGLYVENTEDIDFTFGMAGKMKVDLPLGNIGELNLDGEANAIVNVRNEEKSLYFHGRLDQGLNIDINDRLPISFNEDASVEASGLIDLKNPDRDFLRLKGEFGLNFSTAGLAGLAVPSNVLNNFQTMVLTTAELRINKDGVWIRGEVKSATQLSTIDLRAGLVIELHIDSNLSIPNNSYLKIFGEAGASFEFGAPEYIVDSLPSSNILQEMKIGSTNHVAAAMRISWEGINLGGIISSSSRLSVIKFDIGGAIETFVDFRPGIGESSYLEVESGLNFVVGSFPVFLSTSSRLFVSTSSIELYGKVGTVFRTIEVSSRFSRDGFELIGSNTINTPCVIIGLDEVLLEVSISNASFGYDIEGEACYCGIIIKKCKTVHILGGEVNLSSDNPRITIKVFGREVTLFRL
ncbi:MAG: hypothetical protein SVZ03_03110 [Spirochaetota bacterium]|nr:hypothetical protein [Spirochaetota bacterium]